MRLDIVRRLVAPIIIFWLAGTTAAQAAPGLRSMSNDHFEVVGLDLRSVSYVNELSFYSFQIAERYLDRQGLAFPRSILISLRPQAHVDFEGDYRIRLVERGAVQLDLCWEDSMTLERTCHAIAEALLVQYTIYNYGLEAPQNLRVWTVAALAHDIYFSLRPAEFTELVGRARAGEVPLLTEVVEPLSSVVGETSTAGYWLLHAMKSGSLERPVVRSLFQQAVAGIDIEDALTAAVQPTAEPLLGQDWWAGQLHALLTREYEVIETMEISRSWLAALGRFDAPITLESGEVELNLRSLWTHRQQPEVQELVQARYEILRLRMARVNPAYFNPAFSMGVLFESILNEVPAHKYLHSLTIYLSDWEDTKDLQEKIETILNNN